MIVRLFVFVLFSCAGLFADVVVVPGALAGTEGGTNNTFPFDLQSGTSQRYQQVYAASEFLSSGWITQLAFRPDGVTGFAFASTISNIMIDFSTTSHAPDSLSTTFANNIGLDDTTVFNGALHLASADTGPAGGPKDFDIIIALNTPFFYNPAAGNLLLDVRNLSGGFTAPFDAQNTVGDSISRLTSAKNGVNDLTGSADSIGLVTQLTLVAAVPEPSPRMLLLLGIILMGSVKFLRDRARQHR
jgi:hypothetical protein